MRCQLSTPDGEYRIDSEPRTVWKIKREGEMEARHECLQVAVHVQIRVGTITKHETVVCRVVRSCSCCWKAEAAEDVPGTNAHEPTRTHVEWGFSRILWGAPRVWIRVLWAALLVKLGKPEGISAA